MDKYKPSFIGLSRFLCFVIASYFFLITAEAETISTMTEAEKQTSLEKFKLAKMEISELEALDKTVRDLCASEESESLCRLRFYNKNSLNQKRDAYEFQQGWARDGINKVSIIYINDSDYPDLYSGAKRFRDDESVEFMNEVTDRILIDYLGENYEQFSPLLDAVNENVCISIYIKDEVLLESVLADPRIKSIYHIGDPQRSILVPHS